MQSGSSTLSDRFENVQQADKVSLNRRNNIIIVEVETKIPYRDFLPDCPLRAIMLSYKEVGSHGAPCELNFDCEDQSLVEDIRNKFFSNSNITSGENNSVAIDNIIPNQALDKMEEVFSYLREEGLLIEDEPQQRDGFKTSATSHNYFIGSLDRVLEKRDNIAREECYKIGCDPEYENVQVKLVSNASKVWGQDLPNLVPLSDRPQVPEPVGNYFDV
jgi:hypothetical protein